MKIQLLLTILFLPLLIIGGCSLEESSFNDDMPDFETQVSATNFETGLSIELDAYRDHEYVAGSGELLIDDFRFDIEVLDTYLATDGYYEESIPEVENSLFYDFVCTPRFSEMTVNLTPGNYITTIKLNECEANNESEFYNGSYVYNPCSGYEVIDFDFFNGVCLVDESIGVYYGDDTIEIEEFGDFCGLDVDRCLIPKDVFINVLSSDQIFNKSDKNSTDTSEEK